MGYRRLLLGALHCGAALANTPRDNEYYVIHSQHPAHDDLSKSSRGCTYDSLPHNLNEYVPTFFENVQMELHGTWHCYTKDISDKERSNERAGGQSKTRDYCDLKCHDGYGPFQRHLEINDNHDMEDNFEIKAKRLICHNHQWVPVKGGKIIPRCHDTCGQLTLKDQHREEDKKATVICRNLFAQESETCIPGVDCRHLATCYTACVGGLDTNTPRSNNEISCECDHKNCGWVLPKSLIPNSDGTHDLGKCKFIMTAASKRIIGGDDAKEKDKPVTKSNISAGLLTGKGRVWQHICGGVLLTANWAFTAAHCRTVGLRVLLGEIDFEARTGEEVPCRVRLQIRHPKYDGQTYNDIMMLNLQCRRLKMGDMIWPARLPPPAADVPWGAECKICGWGTMKWPEYAPAKMLQCVQLPIMDRPTCNGPYVNAIHDKIMCIGKLGEGGKDSCQGDSGGGAYCNGVCYGLVMGGLYCADASYPGVYTVVANYVPWAVTVIRVYISKGKSKGKGKGPRAGRRRRSAFADSFLREEIARNPSLIEHRNF